MASHYKMLCILALAATLGIQAAAQRYWPAEHRPQLRVQEKSSVQQNKTDTEGDALHGSY